MAGSWFSYLLQKIVGEVEKCWPQEEKVLILALSLSFGPIAGTIEARGRGVAFAPAGPK